MFALLQNVLKMASHVQLKLSNCSRLIRKCSTVSWGNGLGNCCNNRRTRVKGSSWYHLGILGNRYEFHHFINCSKRYGMWEKRINSPTIFLPKYIRIHTKQLGPMSHSLIANRGAFFFKKKYAFN